MYYRDNLMLVLCLPGTLYRGSTSLCSVFPNEIYTLQVIRFGWFL